jgi:hypothetical protein
MREVHRVLKPGGWSILHVPITANETFEDPSIVDPKERERLFGQFDHVRRYGPDYVDRLAAAGFDVETHNMAKKLGAEEATRLGLQPDEFVFVCRKQPANEGAGISGANPAFEAMDRKIASVVRL